MFQVTEKRKEKKLLLTQNLKKFSKQPY
jgi:hypothetical protein